MTLETTLFYEFKLGIRDLGKSFRYLRVALILSIRNVRSQYRRTWLGPIWFSLEQIIFTLGFAAISSSLFKQSFQDSLSYVGLGVLTLSYLTDITANIDSVINVLSQNKSLSIPLSTSFVVAYLDKVQVYFYRLFGYALLKFFAFGAVGVSSIGRQGAAILGLLGFGLFMVFFIGTLMIRFRDLKPMFQLLNRLSFFITPVFWKPEFIDTKQQSGRSLVAIQDWNPYAIFLQTVRPSGCDPNCIESVLPRVAVLVSCAGLLGVSLFAINARRIRLWIL